MLTSAFSVFASGLVMPACKPPSLSPLPRPLAASDGVHTFTFDSVQRRLPLIIESVLDKNEYGETLQADLRALAAEIAAGAPLKPLIAPSAEWESALAPHLEAGERVDLIGQRRVALGHRAGGGALQPPPPAKELAALGQRGRLVHAAGDGRQMPPCASKQIPQWCEVHLPSGGAAPCFQKQGPPKKAVPSLPHRTHSSYSLRAAATASSWPYSSSPPVRPGSGR